MVVIRLARGGSKKSPFYHVVAADKRESRDGRFIERLGYFNPVARGQATRIEINQERVEYWITKGAQPSERVSSLLKMLKKGGAAIESQTSSATARQAQSDASAAQQAKKLAEEKQAAEAAAKADAEKAEAAPEAPADNSADATDQPAEEAPADDK